MKRNPARPRRFRLRTPTGFNGLWAGRSHVAWLLQPVASLLCVVGVCRPENCEGARMRGAQD